MQLSPLVAPLCVSAALCAAGCSKTTSSSEGTAPSVPPGIRYEAHVAAAGVPPPAIDLRNPHAAGVRANVAAGGNLFGSMNCDGCHGGGGSGWVGPSLIDRRWRYGGADEEIFSSIYFGRPKGMPAYGGVIGVDGVWTLVEYLKAQTVPPVVPTTSYEIMDRAAPAALAPATAPQPSPSAAPATPVSPRQMLTDYGCVACHTIDRKGVGPALKDVAARYKGQPDAENKLAEKVRNGGSGVWGSVPMPPNTQVPDADLHALAKYILSLG